MQTENSRTDKILLAIAAGIFCLCSYLLSNEDFLDNLTTNKAPIIGKVVTASGDSRRRYATDFRWAGLKKEKSIHRGDRVFNGEDSTTIIEFPKQLRLSLEPNSLVIFDQEGDQLKLSLQFGDAKITGGSSLDMQNIKIIKKTTSSNGSLGRSQFQGEAAQWVHSPIQRSKSPSQMAVEADSVPPTTVANEFVAPIYSAPPMTPVAPSTAKNQSQNKSSEKMRPTRAPILESLTTIYEVPNATPLRLAWKEVPRSKAYLVEVSKEPGFKNPQQFKTKARDLVFKTPPARVFYYRVSALGHKNSLGTSSPPGKVIVKASKPKLMPVDLRRVLARSPAEAPKAQSFQLSWEKIPLAAAFELQTSTTADFQKIATEKTTQTSSTIELQEPGEIFTRVRAVDENGQAFSDFSDPIPLKYEFYAQVESPQPREPEVDMSLIYQSSKQTPFWVTWTEVDDVEKYRLEFSTEASFQQKLASVLVPRNRYLVLGKLKTGKYYWRVRAEDGKIFSDWSEARALKVYTGRAPAQQESKKNGR